MYLKVAKKVDLKSSHYKKKIVILYGDKWKLDLLWELFHNIDTYWTLGCIPETDTMFYVNCSSIKKHILPFGAWDNAPTKLPSQARAIN